MTRNRLIQEHLDAIRQLQTPVGEAKTSPWPPEGYYLLWHLLVGMTMGGIGAAVSLLANVIGAPLFGKEPLELIRVYLTFPMGEAALTDPSPKVLTVGCFLYLFTGGFYGIVFHLLMSTLFVGSSLVKRLIVGSVIGLSLWVINFYAILSWLQPMLLGDNWIVERVPMWVAAATHLAFAWTLVAAESWGRFVPYRPEQGRN
jgi:hypothetical protein